MSKRTIHRDRDAVIVLTVLNEAVHALRLAIQRAEESLSTAAAVLDDRAQKRRRSRS